MNISPPVPWSDVPVGATVLDGDTPRTVLENNPIGQFDPIAMMMHLSPDRAWRGVLLEGLDAPLIARADITTHLVLLDDTDAVATLRAAGLTADILETS